jgi:hypothetical protein
VEKDSEWQYKREVPPCPHQIQEPCYSVYNHRKIRLGDLLDVLIDLLYSCTRPHEIKKTQTAAYHFVHHVMLPCWTTGWTTVGNGEPWRLTPGRLGVDRHTSRCSPPYAIKMRAREAPLPRVFPTRFVQIIESSSQKKHRVRSCITCGGVDAASALSNKASTLPTCRPRKSPSNVGQQDEKLGKQ